MLTVGTLYTLINSIDEADLSIRVAAGLPHEAITPDEFAKAFSRMAKDPEMAREFASHWTNLRGARRVLDFAPVAVGKDSKAR